ncbi:MAG TPA: DUF1592 domain-containing protein, partial [Nannocystaceae bacterium]|nr:DUF1592 domain-containing protein [Nannocystaceae bacterium]
LGAAIAMTGCYEGLSGRADGGDDDGASGNATAASVGDDDGGESGDGGTPAEVDAPTMRRLTQAEFTHSVHDLLGPVDLSAIEPDSVQEGFFSVGAAIVALSPSGVAAYELALDGATAQAFADPENAATLVACVPATAADTACMRDSIAAFGRRAWRRPLSAAEVDRYVAIATEVGAETGDGLVALRHALWGVLQSPYFLYRIELGTPSDEDGGRVKFSSWEMASRLSFTLWSTLPDEELLDAAEADALATSAGIEEQATRMLADPRAKQGVANFANELYRLWQLDEKTKDSVLFPEWTPTLKAVLRDELLARIENVVFTQPGDFFSLYDDKTVFVNNELARLYGLPETDPDSFRAATLPDDDPRKGLIGSAFVLAMNSLPARTSATERGQFIAETLLCKTVPPPPPNVDTNLDDDDGMGGPVEHRTLREKLEPHREDPACAGCHNLTDPLGLALEHYDTMGRYRETDEGLTIDASGELDGIPFADGSELALVLREHPDAPGCLVRKLYTFTAGRLPFPSEADALEAIEGELAADDNRFDRLLFALVTHDDFRFAHPAGSVLAPDEGEGP